MNLLDESKQGNILAAQAQEHFMMVYTTTGKQLVRYKFGNALLELAEHDGMQVHRS